MPTLSLNAREQMNAQESGEVPVTLLTITHSDLATPVLLSSDATQRITSDPLVYGTISRGDTYYFLPMQVVYPAERSDSGQMAQLQIANLGDQVREEVLVLLRSTPTPATVHIEVVMASDVDVVEREWPLLALTGLNYDTANINLSLTIDALDREPFPAGSFTPSAFPSLF